MLTVYDDAYVILAGQALTVTTAPDLSVLRNDEGLVFPAMVGLDLMAVPGGGDLQLSADGGFVYTPYIGFTGVDQFEYIVTDSGGQTDAGTVSIHVVPVNVGTTTTTLNLLTLTPEEQIASTYAAFFGRGADLAGFNFWVNEFTTGSQTQSASQLFANIASSFAVSDEAQALYPFLVNPFSADDAQIGDFLNKVYDNLFNRLPDADGLAYWTGQIKDTLVAGQFVGSVLVNIMGGAQNTADGQDITTLISKVAVSLFYLDSQESLQSTWTFEDDGAEATALLDAVTDERETVLIGIAQADLLVQADVQV